MIPEARRRQVLEDTERQLATLGGGFTSYDAQGHWVDPLGGIADEQVIVLEVYSSHMPTPAMIGRIVERILRDLDQAAVAIVLDENMYQFRR